MFHYRNHVNHQDKAEHHESMSSLGLSINSFGAEYFFILFPVLNMYIQAFAA